MEFKKSGLELMLKEQAKFDESRCPECQDTHFLYNNEGLVCRECGAYLEKNYVNSEYNAHYNIEKNSFLLTEISYADFDAKGKKLQPEQKKQMYRLRKLHKRIRCMNGVKILNSAELDVYFGNNYSEEIKNEAAKLFYSSRNILRINEFILPACVYISKQMRNIPETFYNLAAKMHSNLNITKKVSKLNYYTNIICQKLNIAFSAKKINYPVIQDYFNVSKEIMDKAALKYEELKDLNVGRKDSGIFARAFYETLIESEIKITKISLCKYFNISVITLNNIKLKI